MCWCMHGVYVRKLMTSTLTVMLLASGHVCESEGRHMAAVPERTD
jgi:hypothetical protein